MRSRISFAVVILVAFAAAARAEPKAYEVEKYRGKAGGVTFIFNYGAGYPEASEMWVTDGGTKGKRTRFGLDDSGEMRFAPKEERGAKRGIVLKLGMNDDPGDKIEGTYSAGDKQLQFTLRRAD